MKNFIHLILLAYFWIAEAYGATAVETTDQTSAPSRIFIVMGSLNMECPSFPPTLHAVADHEAQVDLTTEAHLLFPYNTKVRFPHLYRIEHSKGYFLILGTHHGFPISHMPSAVLHYVNQSAFLIPELAPTFEPKGDIFQIMSRDQRSKNPLGWKKKITEMQQMVLEATIMDDFYGRGMLLNTEALYHCYPPHILHIVRDCLQRKFLPLPPHHATTDRVIAYKFKNLGKPIYPLEDEKIQQEIADLTTVVDPNLEAINTLQLLLNKNPAEDTRVREVLTSNLAAYAASTREYLQITPPPDTDTLNYEPNMRNKYWLENTLSRICTLHESPGLIMVGCAHLDMGAIPRAGKTGLLNFFHKLFKYKRRWNDIQILGIERLVGTYPDSSFTSERNQYHWTEAPPISTEGPLLDRLMLLSPPAT